MSNTEEEYVKVGRRIAAARREAELSQEELASAVGRSRQSISNYERGKQTPTYDLLEEIADVTDVHVDWLRTGRDDFRGAENHLDYSPSLSENPDQDGGDLFEIQIYRDVRPSAGNGNVIHDAEELNPDTLTQSKWLFKQLIGFWPPDDMIGVYIDGDSMKTVEGPYDDGQLIFYQPVEEMTSGNRYILLAEDAATGDWRLLFKRVQVYSGGGIKILSDNKAAGLEDETLLPSDNGKLIHQTTDLPVRICVVGRVLWPDPDQQSEDVELITQTIERLVNMGMISS